MKDVTRLQADDGTQVEFDNTVIGSGAMKEVYMSPSKEYVVAFFRDPVSPAARERLEMITGRYREQIFEGEQGSYWRELFCWPEKIVSHRGHTGITMPTYRPHFFFEFGSRNGDFLKIQGKEKQGKWFTSANNQNRFLDPRERGDWLSYLRICLLTARSVRRLHAAGLAHSDLSYKNVLVSPSSGHVCIIDVDGLVVPGKYPPDVVGTPDFIAPEVVATSHLSKDDLKRVLPSIKTDQHALAVLIYLYLLLRHPLRGDKVHDLDPQKDETLSMGERALFVEHPDDATNRIDPEKAKPSELPWKDAKRLPYRLTGPYLSELFERAFIRGLHAPDERPTAAEWESALIKTIDLIQPCQNPKCDQKWYVFDNTMAPRCPFCHASYDEPLPVLNLYSNTGDGRFLSDNHRLMVYTNQSLFPWHLNRTLVPNERLAVAERSRLGYFVLHGGQWYLVNERITGLRNADTKQMLPPGSQIELSEGLKLFAASERGARMLVVQMVNPHSTQGR